MRGDLSEFQFPRINLEFSTFGQLLLNEKFILQENEQCHLKRIKFYWEIFEKFMLEDRCG